MPTVLQRNLPEGASFRVFSAHLGPYRPSSHEYIHNRMHGHEEVEVVYCVQGRAIFWINERTLVADPGAVLVIPQGQLRMAGGFEGAAEIQVLQYDPHMIFSGALSKWEIRSIGLFARADFGGLLTAAQHPRIVGAVQEIFEEIEEGAEGSEQVVQAMIYLLSVRLLRAYRAQGRHVPEQPGRLDEMQRVAPAIEHIARHYREEIAMADLCRRCHMSFSTLRRAFHAALGKSPREYLIGFRVSVAAALLRDLSRPIARVSGEAGFADLSSFNRNFKRLMGCAPREWRAADGKRQE